MTGIHRALRNKAQSSTDKLQNAVTTKEAASQNERHAKIDIAMYQAASIHHLAISGKPQQ